MLDALEGAGSCLIVDECRRSGSPSEGIMAGLLEQGFSKRLRRLTAEDSFIPLGPASYTVLPSVTTILDAARDLLEAADDA